MAEVQEKEQQLTENVQEQVPEEGKKKYKKNPVHIKLNISGFSS